MVMARVRKPTVRLLLILCQLRSTQASPGTENIYSHSRMTGTRAVPLASLYLGVNQPSDHMSSHLCFLYQYARHIARVLMAAASTRRKARCSRRAS
ncbi:hypothetical protein F4778DRAFT_765617, partial [Xylariomycetidae sp. FL2044]